MRPPVIPINRTVCVACAGALAELGELECPQCLFESRFAAWAMSDCDLTGAVAMPIEDALRWASCGRMPPRITEVPTSPGRSRRAELAARRVSTWVGLLVLVAFASGWMFARFRMSEMRPCPNAKRAKGRLRFVGEPEYACAAHCALCHGRGYTKPCPSCDGCGMNYGELCAICRGSGKLPAELRSGVSHV